MTIREKTDKETVNEVLLTYDDLVHAHYQVGNELTLLFNPDIQLTDINSFCHNLISILRLILLKTEQRALPKCPPFSNQTQKYSIMSTKANKAN